MIKTPAYAEIVDHKAPVEAAAGESIVIGGTIRNTGTDASYCLIYMMDEFGTIFPSNFKWLAVGEELSVSHSVTMPNEDYTTFVKSAHDEPGRWTYDEEKEATTRLSVAPPEKKPTTLTCYVYPESGMAPLDVMINGRLMTDYYGLNGKLIELYENDVKVDEMLTYRSDARDGTYLFTRTITEDGVYEYHTEFAGDEDYEGCQKIGG